MVYPEVTTGNFLKVRGVLSISKSFTRPQVGAMFADTIEGYLISGESTYIPKWHSYYAIRVEFVAIYRAKTYNFVVTDNWVQLTKQRYSGSNYNGMLNPLAPSGEADLMNGIDQIYCKKIAREYTVQAFQCRIMSDPIPIPPAYIQESKGGGFIFDSPDAYTRADTIPDTPYVLAATMWNGETFTEINKNYPNPLYPDASMRVYTASDGGIGIDMSGLTVPGRKDYYGGSYFLDGYYALRKTERVTIPIRYVGTILVPVTDILYSGNESNAPDWAKVITEEDFR